MSCYTLLHENFAAYFAVSRSSSENREIKMSRNMNPELDREIKMPRKMNLEIDREIKMHEKIRVFLTVNFCIKNTIMNRKFGC